MTPQASQQFEISGISRIQRVQVSTPRTWIGWRTLNVWEPQAVE
jgi:hypothetical protein